MDKPTVHYRRLASASVGSSAVLFGVTDHPNHIAGHSVSNDPERLVTTSPVVAYDQATGRVETNNTIYVPEAA